MPKVSLIGLALLAMLCLHPSISNAAQCTAVFPDGASTTSGSNNRRVTFHSGARIIGSPDNVLHTMDIDGSGESNSCGSGTPCTDNNTPAQTGDFNSFPGSQNITVNENQTLSLSPGNYRNLRVKDNATLTLSPGTYTFREKFELDENSVLTISSAGTVAVYVRKDIEFEDDVVVNAAGGDRRLFFYTRDDFEPEENVTVKAVIYARDRVEFDRNNTIVGAVN